MAGRKDKLILGRWKQKGTKKGLKKMKTNPFFHEVKCMQKGIKESVKMTKSY